MKSEGLRGRKAELYTGGRGEGEGKGRKQAKRRKGAMGGEISKRPIVLNLQTGLVIAT